MDNNQRYSEFDKQFDDLPLPGEEQSWEKMKQLLDEDDKNRKPVIPIFLKSCAGWGLALLLVGAVTWFAVKPQRWWQSKEVSEQTEKQTNQNSLRPNENGPVQNGTGQPGANKPADIIPSQPANDAGDQTPGNETAGSQSTSTASTSNQSSTASTQNSINTAGVAKTNGGTNDKSNASLTPPQKPKPKRTPKKKDQQTDLTAVTVNPGGQSTGKKKNPPSDKTGNPNDNKSFGDPSKTDNIPVTNPSIITADKNLNQDSLFNKNTTPVADSAGVKQQVTAPDSTVVAKKQNSKKTKWIVSAGVGLQQQIPVAGQEAVPYNYYGRTGSLSDYIPSVYVRLEREKKWFVQGEFRYGAPQTLKNFQYSRQTKIDSQNITVTTYRLKKTYYHQLPFSFNYYVLPNLSIGIGGIYNRFYGAVTEKEVKQTDLATQVETLSREIVNIQHFNDSFLYKTQVHALFQAEYHWKRFDFGLRYTKDIQPFIKYTQPDGKIDVKKNQTFQFLVRYSLWRKRING